LANGKITHAKITTAGTPNGCVVGSWQMGK